MRRVLLSLGLLAIALALAGCGGSSKPKAQAGLVSSAGSAGQSADYKPSGKIIADDGFRPQPNGFNFENYPNFSGNVPENMTPANVYALFGSQACESGSGAHCVLTPTASKWMDIENQRMAGGHCMGFSVTALRFFAHNLPINPFGASSTFGLPIRGNLGLQSLIAQDWVFQDLQSVQSRKVAGTPTRVLQALVGALQISGKSAYSGNGYGSRGELYTLVIFKADGTGGHAITPYAVENQGNGHYVILVYDNNFPGVTRPFYVDTNTDTWKYVGGINPSDTNELYNGDATTQNMSLLPTSPGVGPQTCPFCNGGPASRSSGQLPRDNRQHHPRWVLRVVEDALQGWLELGAAAERQARVGITIEPRKVRAANLQANPVAGHEQVARRPEIDRVFVDPLRLDQGRLLLTFAVPRPNDPIGQIAGETVRFDVHELRGEVTVDRG